MIHRGKDIKITVNGREIAASQCSIDYQAQMSPIYQGGARETAIYKPEALRVGKIVIDYPLCQYDFIKDAALVNDTLEVSIDNIVIKSGYISAHTISIDADNYPTCSTAILFYEDIDGSRITGSQRAAAPMVKVTPNTTNVSVNWLNPFASGDIISYKWSFERPIDVYYNWNGSGVGNISCGQPLINTDITVSNPVQLTSLSGDRVALELKVFDARQNENESVNTNLLGAYFTSGIISSQSTNISDDAHVVASYSIKQAMTTSGAVITNIYFISPEGVTSTGTIVEAKWPSYSTVVINGYNSDFIDDILFQDTVVNRKLSVGKTSISAVIPENIISGRIFYTENGALHDTHTQYSVNHLPIIINRLSANTLMVGEKFSIEGDNFYRIDSVKVGDSTCNFAVVNNKYISATMPNCTGGLVTVSSSVRGLSASSAETIIPHTKVTGITALSGAPGNTVIIKGLSLHTSTNVYFAETNKATFTVLGATGLSVIVPTGQIYGKIKVVGTTGAVSDFKFEPIVYISGLSRSSGQICTALEISGVGFTPDNLYSANFGDTTGCLLRFADATPFFYIVNNTLITGSVPDMKTPSGFIQIVTPDGATCYDTYKSFVRIPSKPAITKLEPTTIISGFPLNMAIYGSDLSNPTDIYITGLDKKMANEFTSFGKRITPAYIYTDVLGLKANIYNYPTTGIGITGLYGIIYVTPYGACTGSIGQSLTLVSGV